jgi:type VI secretion system protein ImpH
MLEASFGFEFPASEVQSIQASVGAQPRLRTSLFGLGGAHGPLPNVDSEIVLARSASKDGAFQAFLGIFNHRLLSLLYRVKRQTHIGLVHMAPHRTPFAHYLFALLGLGTPGLDQRMQVEDRALLQYAGLLAGGRRSAAGLEALLTRYLGINARLEPFMGRWLALDPAERSILGRPGRHVSLGYDAALGGRVWDVQSAFTIAIGPLSESQFRTFLPDGTAYRHLVSLTKFYAGQEQDTYFRLELAPGEAKPASLSRASGALLGWTSWLCHPSKAAGALSICVRTT